MAIDLTNVAAVDAVRAASRPRASGQARAPEDLALPGTHNGRASGNSVPPAADPTATVDRAELSAAVSRLNNHVQNISRDLEFTVDEELDRVIIKVYDSQTDEVIRQIPPEEVLQFARHLADSDGVILKTKA